MQRTSPLAFPLLALALFLCFSPSNAFAAISRPPADIDNFDEKQLVMYHLYNTEVGSVLFGQVDIMNQRVNKNVKWQQSIADLAITIFDSTLSLRSALNPNISDLDLLTLTLSKEWEFLSVIRGGGEIQGIWSDALMAALETSRGDRSAFASYCATHLVSAAVDFYGAYQHWELAHNIDQLTALNDLMYNYYAFGRDCQKIKEFYEISPQDCPEARTNFDCLVRYFSRELNVDYQELSDGALKVMRYMNQSYNRYERRLAMTPSLPRRFPVPDAVNPEHVVLSWDESSCEDCGSVAYNLEVHQDGQSVFKADRDLGHLLTETTYTLPLPLDPNQTYDWAVFPRSQYNVWNLSVGPWSSFSAGGTDANTPPQAHFSLSAGYGQAGTTFTADAGRSQDQDGDPLQYSWDWGAGQGFSPWSEQALSSHRYEAPGRYSLTLRVSDGEDTSYYAQNLTIQLQDAPPLQARDPQPGQSASDQPEDMDLSWADGGGAESYTVSFGIDPDPDHNPKTTRHATTYDPGRLEYGTTYYWRVDARNDHGLTIGDRWIFTTQDPPPWLAYHFWDFDTDGTEGWSGRNAASEGIFQSEYWIIDPGPDPVSKSGIISPPQLSLVHTRQYHALEVRAAVKNAFLPSLEAHLKIDGAWTSPFALNHVSGRQTADSQCVYRGDIPHSGRIEQVRIDVLKGSDQVDDRVFIDRVGFMPRPELPGHEIAGYVRDQNREGLAGVTLTFSGLDEAVVTDGTGRYQGLVPDGWSGSVTSSKPVFEFEPETSSYSEVSQDLTQDYTGSSTADLTSKAVTAGSEPYHDGFVFNHGFSQYTAVQSNSTGNQVSQPGTTTMLSVGQDRAISGEYYVYRAMLPFDTSSLPNGATITGASLLLPAYGPDYSETDFDLELVQSHASGSTLELSDFSKFGSLSGGSLHTSSWQGHNQVNIIHFNPQGLSWIDPEGMTVLGLRSSRDIAQVEPGGHEFVNIWSAGADKGYVPRLEIEWEQVQVDEPEGLQGTVLDQRTGQPLGQVSLSTPGQGTTSSDDGDYTLFLEPGTYSLTCSRQGYQTVTLQDIQIQEGIIKPLNIELPVSLFGTVTDKLSGEPVVHVDVAVNGSKADQTTNQGLYVLGELEPGSYDLSFAKQGYQSVQIADVMVQAGNSTELDVQLPVSLAGTVTDYTTGRPISNVIVSTIGDRFTQSDPQGRYAFGRLPPGVYDLTFAKTGYQTVTRENVIVYGEDPVILDVRMTLPGVLNIVSSTLPAAENGTAYNPVVGINGGTPPYTFTMAAGELPPGLHLDSEHGNITGTPRSTGSFTFTVRVSDALGARAERQYTLVVYQPLTIVSRTLPRADLGASYQTGIRASGGSKPYTFSCSGDFPLDLNLSQAGNISNKVSPTVDFESGVLHRLWHTDPGVLIREGRLQFDADNGQVSARIELDCIGGEIGFDLETRFAVGYYLSGSFAFYIDGVEQTSWGGSHSGRYSAGVSPGSHVFKWVFDSARSDQLCFIDNVSFPVDLCGTHTFEIQVEDSAGRTASQPFQLEVSPPLQIASSRLHNGQKGHPYTQTLSAQGGSGRTTWSIYAGSLPQGLSLDQTSGTLAGTPLQTWYGSVVFQVMDEQGRTEYKDLVLQVSEPLNIETRGLARGLIQSPYSEAIRVSGGVPPYTFSYQGQLPKGLTLDPQTGIVSGTPSTAGYSTIMLRVTDSAYPTTHTRSRSLGFEVSGDLTITTSSVLPPGLAGTSVSPVQLAAGGGPSPYTWRVAAGFLPAGISLDSQTGELAGTPERPGNYLARIEVTDALHSTAVKEFFWEIENELRVRTTAVPDGVVDEPYAFTLEAHGGQLPYQWRLAGGTLPDGLSLEGETGTITGSPTSRQTFSFTLEAGDSGSPMQTVEQSFVLEILDELCLTTRSLPDGRKEAAYTAEVKASAGTPPYSWRLQSGVLPPGLELNSTKKGATLAGTPSQEGTYPFTLAVSDSGTPVATAKQQYTIEIGDNPLIATSRLRTAQPGVPYSDTIKVQGGTPPYTWQVVQGSLPSGLHLNQASGHIAGTTNLVSGQSSAFTVRVTDSGLPGISLEKELYIPVTEGLRITTPEFQKGLQKAPYQSHLQARGGISPYTWSLSSGALPPGLSLNATTGLLSGRPELCGAFDFTIRVRDGATNFDQATKAYQLTVLCCESCYELSGQVGELKGASVTLSGAQSDNTTTAANGTFGFSGLSSAQYQVSASKQGYWISPVSRPVDIAQKDVSGINFSVQPNRPPHVPHTPQPANGTAQVLPETELAWKGGDPDTQDDLEFDLLFGTKQPLPRAAHGIDVSSFDPGRLTFGNSYFWQVVSRDQWGQETFGPVWRFRTLEAGDLNQDGKVGLQDLILALQATCGHTTPDIAACDLSGDGSIGLQEAMKILQVMIKADVTQ